MEYINIRKDIIKTKYFINIKVLIIDFINLNFIKVYKLIIVKLLKLLILKLINYK